MNPERPSLYGSNAGRSEEDSKVFERTGEDLKDLFRSAKDPVAVLLQTMEAKEFKESIPPEMARDVRAKLEAAAQEGFENADDFARRVTEAARPILDIRTSALHDTAKQGRREMYSKEDLQEAIALVKKIDARRIYVVGNVGTGKTSFARELSRALDATNIDVDKYFSVFRQEQGRDAADLTELVSFIRSRERTPFVMNHADLLRQNLIRDADMIVYLNPKREEQIRSRQARQEQGAEGEWQSLGEDAYDEIIRQNTKSFENIEGELAYRNAESGTSIKVMSPHSENV